MSSSNYFEAKYPMCKYCKLSDSATYTCSDCVGDYSQWEPNHLFKQQMSKHGYKLKQAQYKSLIVLCMPGCGQEEIYRRLKNTDIHISYYSEKVKNILDNVLSIGK